MHFSAKYRLTKFLTFLLTTALQRLQIELRVRGWIPPPPYGFGTVNPLTPYGFSTINKEVGPLAWLDAPDQFPNYVLFSRRLGVWLTPSL